jgi:membrane fusion protein, multidrug efflux system
MSEFIGRPGEANGSRAEGGARNFNEAASSLQSPTLTRLRMRPKPVDGATAPHVVVAREAPVREHEVSTRDGARAAAERTRFWLMTAAALAALICAGWELSHYLAVGRFIYSTDDAYVRTDLAIISPKISGYVQDVDVKDNQHVKAGQVLARIDAGDYVLAVDAARQKALTQDATIARINAQIDAQDAMVAQAEAQVEAARAERARAQSEFDLVRSLAASGFASKQRLDQVVSDRDKAIAGLSGAQARLAGAKANLDVLKSQSQEAKHVRAGLAIAQDRAERDLSFAEIRAPFNGVIGNRVVQPGQFVQPGARLMAIAPDNDYYVDANFKETQLDRLTPGEPAKVYVDAYDEEVVDGVVESIAPASGSEFSLLPPENATGNFTKITQRFPVRIKLAHLESGRLRAGMSVVVDVDTRGRAK